MIMEGILVLTDEKFETLDDLEDKNRFILNLIVKGDWVFPDEGEALSFLEAHEEITNKHYHLIPFSITLDLLPDFRYVLESVVKAIRVRGKEND